MHTIHKVGQMGVTQSIDTLISIIKENRESLFNVLAVNDGDDNYTFIAVFREKGTVGQFVSFVQEYGTNDGRSGEGGSGFTRMMKCLKQQNISNVLYELSDNEKKSFAFVSIFSIDEKVRLEFWEKLVENEIISEWRKCQTCLCTSRNNNDWESKVDLEGNKEAW